MRSLRTRLPLAALALLALAAPAAAAKPPKLRVESVATSSIDVSWSARHGGRGSWSLRWRTADGPWSDERVRNAERARIRGLERGRVYEAEVARCAGSCGPWSRPVRTATLLAPFNGPHPDPGCETFPASDEFNRDVSGADVASGSDQVIDRINADGGDSLHPDFGSNPSYGIPFVVVPGEQPGVPIRFGPYGDESDPGPYPVPPGAPIEGGRRSDGDRHVLVVRRPRSPGGPCTLFELYRARERGGARNAWSADSGAIFDLGSPLAGQRPNGWTSADAAGLPIYPGLVTYEEATSGVIDHAIRVTFEQTRRGYVAPATHYASDSCNQFRPAMGMRLRLAPDYDISGMTGTARTIAVAMKTYGLIVADNGSNWYISGSTDRRWNDENLNQLKDIPGTAFQVVDSGPEVSPC
ncbi:MAG: fibronectin type III domain-containing protein [Solirubrobacterales bacterium]